MLLPSPGHAMRAVPLARVCSIVHGLACCDWVSEMVISVVTTCSIARSRPQNVQQYSARIHLIIGLLFLAACPRRFLGMLVTRCSVCKFSGSSAQRIWVFVRFVLDVLDSAFAAREQLVGWCC